MRRDMNPREQLTHLAAHKVVNEVAEQIMAMWPGFTRLDIANGIKDAVLEAKFEGCAIRVDIERRHAKHFSSHAVTGIDVSMKGTEHREWKPFYRGTYKVGLDGKWNVDGFERKLDEVTDQVDAIQARRIREKKEEEESKQRQAQDQKHFGELFGVEVEAVPVYSRHTRSYYKHTVDYKFKKAGAEFAFRTVKTGDNTTVSIKSIGGNSITPDQYRQVVDLITSFQTTSK